MITYHKTRHFYSWAFSDMDVSTIEGLTELHEIVEINFTFSVVMYNNNAVWMCKYKD